MGLDMSLNAERYVCYEENDSAFEISKFFPELDKFRVKSVVVEVAYWRKANAIHNWFVENVQGGKDDCGSYWVRREELKELRDLVSEVLETKNAKKLPPKPGFFFGSTDVDDYYWEDLRETIEMIDKVLELPKEWIFEYESSW